MRSRPNTAAAVAALLFAVVLLGGCGDDEGSGGGGGDGGGLSIEVEPAAVAPGGTLAASVVNETDREFSYGAGYELERQRGTSGGFEPVDLGDRAVIQIAYVAEPGGRGPAVAVKVPRGAEPGTWRVIIARDIPGGGDLSAEFEVKDG